MASMAEELRPRLASALSGWDRARDLGPELRDRVRAAKTSWLVAEPLEPLRPHEVTVRDDYAVTAADGSQIYPDRHEMAHCFLVNVGTCSIDYRTGRAALRSHPQLHWLPDDLYPEVGGERQEADGRVVGARRFAAECRALDDAVNAAPDTLALVDGTLLLWWLEPDPDRLAGLGPRDVKTQTFAALRRLLARAREAGATVAAYLSAPRTTDVVSMLKVVLCTEDPVDCDRCPYASGEKTWLPSAGRGELPILPSPDRPCAEADPLTDAAVFASLLDPGERSPRFRSAAKVANAYDAPIDFVYLHSGSEIARLEFPAWVTPEGLDALAGAVADQCAKGYGYPVSLAEAHEQAVVRAADRRAFLELLRRHEPRGPSAKLARKRVGVL